MNSVQINYEVKDNLLDLPKPRYRPVHIHPVAIPKSSKFSSPVNNSNQKEFKSIRIIPPPSRRVSFGEKPEIREFNKDDAIRMGNRMKQNESVLLKEGIPIRPSSGVRKFLHKNPIILQQPKWDAGSNCVDRDLLNIDVDLRNHRKFKPTSIPKVQNDMTYRQMKKDNSKVFKRDRISTNKCGTVVNNPFQVYPFLHKDAKDIHSYRWDLAPRIPLDHPERYKPMEKDDARGHDAFIHDFDTDLNHTSELLKIRPQSTGNINVVRNISSVQSIR